MSNRYGPRIVTDGLVLCLDAADNNSYPGTGTTWSDLSGNGNNGTLTNGPTYSSGNKGSVVFDGTNDYVDCGKPTTLNFGTGSFAISLWFYVTSGNLLKVIANKGAISATNSSGWWIAPDNRYNSNLNGIAFCVNSTSVNTSYAAVGTTLSYIVNQWNYIVCIWDTINKTSSIYINNIMSPTTVVQTAGSGLAGVTNTDNSNYNNIIGAYDNGASFYFPGRISQTLMYNRVLSAVEVAQNYNATKGRFNL